MGVSNISTITTIASGASNDSAKGLDSLEAKEYRRDMEGTPDFPTSANLPQPAHTEVFIDYPEGGLRAWGVLLGAFLNQFCSFGYICAFGVYQDYYTRIYMATYSASAISWIGSTSPFLLFFAGLFVGRLYDRGYCMHLLYGGSLLTSLSLFMLSFVKPNQLYAAFLCQGVGVGLGGGMIYLPSLGVLSQYFNKKRNLAIPIATAGVSLGGALTPIMLNNLLQQGMDFGTVSRIYAGFITALLILACLLIAPRLAPPKSHATIVNCLRRFSTDRAYVLLTIGYIFFGLAVFFPAFFLQLAAMRNGFGDTFAFYTLVILNASGFCGRVLCAILAGKVGVDTQAIVSMVVCGSVVFAFIATSSKVSILLVGIIYGVFWGIFVGTMAPMTALLTENMDEIGLRMGITFAFAGLAELIGPPIMGALLSGYQWWRPAVFSGTLLLAAAACFVVIRRILQGKGAEVQRVDHTGKI